MWGSYGVATTGTQSSALSFTIPLANAPEAIFVDLNNEDSKPGCPGLEGGTEGVPTADEGKLCVYAQTFEEAEFTGIFTPDYSPGFEAYELAPGASKTGAIVRYTCQATFCSIVGPWAVTAE
jgi:hypothetical protein